MAFRAIFQVNDFRLTKRTNPASQYADTAEKLDLWKVHLAHGYYAGLGMEFWFPTEGEASRFSLWTLYDQGQLIDVMDNRNFRVWKVAKTFRMGARNRYTGIRALQDFWRVGFEGEFDEYLDIYFPTEHEATAFRFGKSYSMVDLFGTMPAVPQDMAFLLRERVARLREQERPPGTGPGGGGPGGADDPGGNPPPAPPPPPTPPPPPPPLPPTPYEQLQATLANAPWAKWFISAGGARGYYARTYPDNLSIATGTRYSQVAAQFKSVWRYWDSGEFGNGVSTINGITSSNTSNGPQGEFFFGWYVNSPFISP